MNTPDESKALRAWCWIGTYFLNGPPLRITVAELVRQPVAAVGLARHRAALADLEQ